MKICFFLFDRPDYHAGPAVNAQRLLPELGRRGHAVHALVMYHGPCSPAAGYLQSCGVIVHQTPMPRFTEPRIRWFLARLRQIRPDVFVPNISVAGWYASRWVRAAGIPTVAAYRNDDAFHWDMVRRFVVGPKPWAVSGVVCVNRSLHQRVEALAPRYTKLVTIASGVPVPDQAVLPGEGPLRLVYAGRLVEKQKRIFDVLAAMITVAERLPEVYGAIYGLDYNGERAQIEATIARHGLSDRLACPGPVPPQRIQQVLRHFDILLLLSEYEGTPAAVMDAMACGLIPVCFDLPGGLRDLVIHEQTGLIVADRGPAVLAAVERLRSDLGLRIRLSANARAHICKHFSIAAAATAWERFLERLIMQEGAGRKAVERPWRYRLPPVLEGHAGEDRRRPRIFSRPASLLKRAISPLIDLFPS